MSTGDQSAYIRSKVAERGLAKTPKFMRDGFDAWAESSAPAREGGMEKEPAEMTGLGRKAIHEKYVGRTQMPRQTHTSVGPPAGQMLGGIGMDELFKLGSQLYDFYNKVKDFTGDLKQDLRDPEVMPAGALKSGKAIADALEMIGLGKPPHQAIYESCLKHMPPKMRGGAMTGGAWQDWFKTISKNLLTAYNWFLANKANIHKILKMRVLNPKGQEFGNQIEGFLTSVGLGRRRGGAMTPAQMEQAAREAMQEVKMRARQAEGVVSPYVANLVKKAKKATAKVGGARCNCMFRGGNYETLAEGDGPSAYSGPKMSKEMERKAIEIYNSPNSKQKADWISRNSRVVDYLRSLGLIGNARGGAWYDEIGNAFSGMSPMKKGREEALEMNPDGQMLPGGAIIGNGRAPSARGAIVKKVMREMGLSLPEASKYVKQNGLY